MKNNPQQPLPFEEFSDEQLDDFLNYSEQFNDEHKESIKKRFILERDKNETKIIPMTNDNSTRKVWTIVLSVALLFIVLGAFTHFTSIQKVYYKLFGVGGEEILQKSDKILSSIEENGFNLQIVRSFRDEGRTYILAELTDMEEDRLDENTQIEKWTMNNDYGGNFWHGQWNQQVIDYNSKTKTVTFIVSAFDDRYQNDYEFKLEEFGTGSIESADTISFDFNHYLEKEVTWKNVSTVGYSVHQDMGEFARKGIFSIISEEDKETILKTDESSLVLSKKNNCTLSNVGYRNNKLHLQVKNANSELRKYTDLALKDKHTEELIYPIGILNLEHGYNFNTQRGDYDEYIFDVSQSELMNYDLYIESEDYTSYQKGSWKIKIEEPTALPSIQMEDTEIDRDGHQLILSNIKLSPISLKFAYGFRIEGPSLIPSFDIFDKPMDIVFNMTNGKMISYNSLELNWLYVTSDTYPSQFSENHNSTIQFFIDYIDIEKVKSITFNGVEAKVESQD